MAVEDVPRGGDKATAVTHPVQCVRVDLKVALTVCFSGEGRQTDETDKWTLTCGRTGRDNKLKGNKQRAHLPDDLMKRLMNAYWSSIYKLDLNVLTLCLFDIHIQQVWLSPLCVRMWISSELALGQLLLHCGKGQMRSLG